MATTYFKLHGAYEYTVRGVGGRPTYRFVRNVPLAVNKPEDAARFRKMPELLVECDMRGKAENAPTAEMIPARTWRSFKPLSTSSRTGSGKVMEQAGVDDGESEKPAETDSELQPKREFVCDICGASFDSRRALNGHFSGKHGGRKGN